MPAFRAIRLFTVALLVALLGTALLPPGRVAEATVVPRLGYRATVDGFTSWYGSYDMGSIGRGWCIDHGIAAPDPEFDYVATEPAASEDTLAAMAWLAGRHGFTTDRITSAAMMLALHDLMGAVYPSGRLDVGRLGPERLAGFEGDETEVLARARELKAEAIERGQLTSPFVLTLAADPVAAGERGVVRASVTDANERPVPGAIVVLSSPSADLGTGPATTGPDGTIGVDFRATDASITVDAYAVVPDLDLAAFAPSRQRAQRIVVSRQVLLEQQLTIEAPPGSVTVRKTGDATDVLPIVGARFELRSVPAGDPVAELVISADGTAGPIDVEPGKYELVETSPPAGYVAADVVRIEVASGQETTVDVHNLAVTEPLIVEPVPHDADVETPEVEEVDVVEELKEVEGDEPDVITPTTDPPKRFGPPVLPRTGTTTVPTTLVGAGIVFLGAAMTIGAEIGPDGRFRPTRRWRPPTRRRNRRVRARSSGGAWRTRRSTRPPSAGRR